MTIASLELDIGLGFWVSCHRLTIPVPQLARSLLLSLIGRGNEIGMCS